MDIRVAIGVASLNRSDLLGRCVESLSQQKYVRPNDIYLVQNGLAVKDVCDNWAQQGVRVHRPGKNLGTCASWNWLLQQAFTNGYGAMLVLNDDVVLTDYRTVEILTEVFRGVLRQLRFLSNRGYSAICISKTVWDEVGPFDEGFWPAYFEDNDHHRRVILAGIPWDEVKVDTDHVGSATLQGEFASLNGYAFGFNSNRYHAKWGNGPGQETYGAPWNGGGPQPSTRDILPAEIREKIEAAYP